MKQSREYYPNPIQLRIIEIADRNNIKVHVCERTGQDTQPVGCSKAVLTTAYELGLVDRKVTVHTTRGELKVELLEDGRVTLSGADADRVSVAVTRR